VVSFTKEIHAIVNVYSILVGVGASLAILRVVQSVPRWQASRWANASLLVLLGSVIGARLAYVFLQWGYFKTHLLEIVVLWSGGLSWFGAALGALAMVFVIAARWHTTLFKIADGLAPMIPPMVISSWLGCWLIGAAYGPTAPPGAFWAVPSQDEFGVVAPRFPLQIIAAVSMLVYAFILDIRKPRFDRDGKKASWMLLGLGLNLAIFMPLRADPAPMLFGMKFNTWAGIIFLLFSGVLLLWVLYSSREKNRTENE
jgi:phosphatidylglycerol:prolipoprotein diacylglycerol transferase